jgi:hypothetical protein
MFLQAREKDEAALRAALAASTADAELLAIPDVDVPPQPPRRS